MVTNFSNNAACRGGVLLRAEFMMYPSQHYPDSMANLYNNLCNGVFEREVVSAANYQRYIKQSKAQSQHVLYQDQLQVIRKLDDLMKTTLINIMGK
jgi:hypothetical protein